MTTPVIPNFVRSSLSDSSAKVQNEESLASRFMAPSCCMLDQRNRSPPSHKFANQSHGIVDLSDIHAREGLVQRSSLGSQSEPRPYQAFVL
jgi:hypothetical protein